MKSSQLNRFFQDLLSGIQLQNILVDITGNYEKLLQKRGSTIPLQFHEDERLDISTADFQKLLTAVEKQHLSNITLSYICDCLTLGEDVTYQNEKIEDMVHEIADPEINGGFESPFEIGLLIERLALLR